MVRNASPAPEVRREGVPLRRAAEGSGLAPELVAPVVPAHILHEDEIVLILTKPSLFFIVFTSLRFVAVTALAGVLAARLSADLSYSAYAVAFATTALCVGRLIWALLVWTSHIYMLTNQRIVTIKGVINVHMFQAHLRKIQRAELYAPFHLRLFGMGTIGFATAATTTLDSTWVMIARPLETQEQIAAAIHKAQGSG